MNLQLRLILGLFLVFLLSASLGAYGVIFNAQHAVKRELHTALDLASHLASAIVRMMEDLPAQQLPAHWPPLPAMTDVRHMHIAWVARHQPMPSFPNTEMPDEKVPLWFREMVLPPVIELERRIALPGGAGDLVLRADPVDEIAECWREARVGLYTLMAFALCSSLLVMVAVRRALAPLRTLSEGLTRVEEGDFATRVQASGVPDVDQASASFNHMASALAESRARADRLAQRAISIREEERRHLARELHDDLGQSVSAIKALAVAIEHRAHDSETIRKNAATISEVSGNMYDAVRRMMASLHPRVLDELGLISALRHMHEEWQERYPDFLCHLELPAQLPVMPSAVGIAIYRITQEALTNIARHAGECEVRVQLEHLPQRGVLRLLIQDNGAGFDPASIQRGLGLVGIEERVRGLGGRWQLASRPGQGTRFEIEIPENPT